MTWKIGQKLVHANGSESDYSRWAASSGQAYWETLGWTAVPEPAPVERTLIPPWIQLSRSYACGGCDGGACPAFWSPRDGRNLCPPCAEKAGAFVDAPKVEPPAPAKPAPVVEAPRAKCEWNMHCSAATSVRVMMWRSRPARVHLCDKHYMEGADMTGAAWAKEQTGVATGLQTRSPATPPGLVPQSFGDERLGGVWASRGMRIAAGSLPPRPSCPMHPNGGCDGTTGCTRPR